MKNFIKKFPLTIYSVIIVLTIFLFVDDSNRDEILPIDPVFWVMILALPLIAIGQIYNLLEIKLSLPFVIPIFFLFDLALIYLRTKLIPKLKLSFKKNKNHHNL